MEKCKSSKSMRKIDRYAAGGVAKIRHGESTLEGMPKSPRCKMGGSSYKEARGGK